MTKMIFASDIDKTLTDERHLIPDEVINYLEGLHQKGWEIVLLTGRTFSFAMMSVEKITFPFYLALQNGAEVLKMPEKETIFQTFLPKSVAYFVDGIYREFGEDFLLYSGLEKGDFCYYRTSRFSPWFLNYIEKLKPLASGEWVEVDGLEEIPQTSFPLIKGLGSITDLKAIQKRLASIELTTSSIIFDSVEPKMSILLITHKEVNKGIALNKLKKHCGWTSPIIAAGDDNNDIPLLEAADIRIAMKTGSPELQKIATILAESSYELGIIAALEQIKGTD